MMDIKKRDWLHDKRKETLDLIHEIEKQLDEHVKKIYEIEVFQHSGSKNIIKAYQNENDQYNELCIKFHKINDWIRIMAETGSTDHIDIDKL